MNQPALALLEFDSIALGIKAGDAMVKRAPVATIQSGTVQPGNYLVMVTGDVAPVEEAVAAGQEAGRGEQEHGLRPDVDQLRRGERRADRRLRPLDPR